MKKIFFTILIVLVILTQNSCSTKYVSLEVDRFSKATESISSNTLKVYELVSEEEMSALISRSLKKGRITPADFERSVVTGKSFKIRKKLIKVLGRYAKALRSLLCGDDKVGADSINRFNDSLKSISERHGNFITEEKRGLIKSLLSDILLSTTIRKKRRAAVKAMKEVQPLLVKISEKMCGELKSLKLLTDNFLSYSFKVRVVETWPDNRVDRLKYAETGAGILKKKSELKEIFDCAIKSMKSIPLTHFKLMGRLLNGKISAEEINRLLDKAIEFEESYLKIAKGGA